MKIQRGAGESIAIFARRMASHGYGWEDIDNKTRLGEQVSRRIVWDWHLHRFQVQRAMRAGA